ncbi:MAG TPA: trypsin-like serine protease [Natronosporangium sp.]
MTDRPIQPPDDRWTVAIHRDSQKLTPIGAGVVIDRRRVLTCAHLLLREGRRLEQVWLTFPKAEIGFVEPLRVTRFTIADGPLKFGRDVAVLELDAPLPPGVRPAPLRCVPPRHAVRLDWWAFGFPNGEVAGDVAAGEITEELAHGQIKLGCKSPVKLAVGFSGSAVWSPTYEAVIGLVVKASVVDPQHGAGHALTLYAADQVLKLGLGALDAWGWRLGDDPEADRHWLSRSRAGHDGGADHRFHGRSAALRRIVDWLERPAPDGAVLVLTGSPGAGKSAVLGRIVTTADPVVRNQLPADDWAVRARPGAVACAVHLRGKTARETAREIARGASVRLPDAPADLVPALRERLESRRLAGIEARFNLVLDALDEMAGPGEARRLITEVLLPLADTGRTWNAQVLVGTRAQDADGDLLGLLADQAAVIDLDSPTYFSRADLVGYVEGLLHRAAAGRDGSPYTNPAVTGPVAQRIATQAGSSFVAAELAARAYGERGLVPSASEQRPTADTVGEALDAYLDGLAPVGTTPARLVLTALAYAELPGLPLPLWRAAVVVLGGSVTEAELADFARDSAGAFLVEANTGPAVRSYRLAHQAVAEALRARRAANGRAERDEYLIFRALLEVARYGPGWSTGYDYYREHLPAHAARAGRVDTLLADDWYLLHCDLRRLAVAAETAQTPVGQARARLLRLTPEAFDAGPAERAAMFAVTQRIDRLDSKFRHPGGPYRVQWAQTPARPEFAVLTGHADRVLDLAPIRVAGRRLLASAGADGTVRLWDPATGQPGRVLSGHTAAVRAVSPVTAPPSAGFSHWLASAGEDHVIRLWNPVTGECERTLTGHTDWVRDLYAVPVGDRKLLASVGDDRTVRLWDPATGTLVRTLTGHSGWVAAVVPIVAEGRQLLASAGYDPQIRLWDPMTGTLVRTLDPPGPRVSILCPVRIDGRELLAAGGYGGGVQLREPATGELVHELPSDRAPVTGIAAIAVGDTVLVAVTTDAGEVRLWDLVTGEQVRRFGDRADSIHASCAFHIGGQPLLATAGDSGPIRLWDPATGERERVLDQDGPVVGLTALTGGGDRTLAGTGRDGSVRLWDPATGEPKQTLPGHAAPVTSVCPVRVGGVELLASGSEDRTVRLWDPRNRQQVRTLRDDGPGIAAVCAVPVADGERLAVASGTVRIWHPGTGKLERVLSHLRWVTALCVVPTDQRRLLASSDEDGTVRLWDPPTGTLVRELRCHHGAATALCAVPAGGRQLLASASVDQTILLWDPLTGDRIATLAGHTGPVTGLCLIPGDRRRLASTSTDQTVRVWDLDHQRSELTIPVHHPALACWADRETLVIGLDSGLLALELVDEPEQRRESAEPDHGSRNGHATVAQRRAPATQLS